MAEFHCRDAQGGRFCLAFDPAQYGLSVSSQYYLDSYPSGHPTNPQVAYSPFPHYNSGTQGSPWGYLTLIGPEAGRRRTVRLRDASDLQEVIQHLAPGAQVGGALSHLSVLVDRGLVDTSSSANPRWDSTLDAMPWLSCAPPPIGDVAEQQQLIQQFCLGRVSPLTVLEWYQTLKRCGAPIGDHWRQPCIEARGLLLEAGQVVQTGDGSIRWGDGTTVDAPSGTETELPPGMFGPGPTDCPPGFDSPAPGVCVRIDDGPPPEVDPDGVIPIAGPVDSSGPGETIQRLEGAARRYWWAFLAGALVLGSMAGAKR